MGKPYKSCPRCGSHLDYGESCDCNERAEKEEIRKAAAVIKTACTKRTADTACASCPCNDYCETPPYTWEV